MDLELVGYSLPYTRVSSTGTGRPPFSSTAKIWLASMAQIILQVDQSIVEDWPSFRDSIAALRSQDRQQENRNGIQDFDPVEEYDAWRGKSWKRMHKRKTIPAEETRAYVMAMSRLYFLRALYLSWAQSDSAEGPYPRQVAIFVNLGRQLRDTALAIPVAEISQLPDIIEAIQLHLSTLASFGEFYHVDCDDKLGYAPGHFNWDHALRAQLCIAIEEVDKRKSNETNDFLRPPSQQQTHNLVLQTIVGITILTCTYPLYRAMKASPPHPGSVSDADFWTQIINSIVQLIGFTTMLLPIYRETAAKEWIGAWFLTGLGCCSAVIAVPLYFSVAVSWSVFLSWVAAVSQLLVVLQVALVASFRPQVRDHAKRD